jgi:RimJ/RimL family protein N-acetyltransferase
VKAILLDIPEQFETDRLIIRAPRAGDGAEINAAIYESFESLALYMPWARERPTPSQSEEYIRRARAWFIDRTDLALLLYHKPSGEFVGGSGLHRPKWDVPRFEIGYWCRKKYEGQGYISEAVRGITRFAFETLGAKRVEIRCDILNERSRRVAESVGYHLDATLRNNGVRANGDLRDTLVYSLIPEQYEHVRTMASAAGRCEDRS